MSILRHELSGNFAMIPNDLWAAGMTMQGKAAIGYLLSKPDDWDVRIDAMARDFDVGREAMRNALRSAQEAGWLYRLRQQHSDGTWEIVTVVRDSPLDVVPPIDSQGCQDMAGIAQTRRPVKSGAGAAQHVSKDGRPKTENQEARKKTSSPSSSRTRAARSSRRTTAKRANNAKEGDLEGGDTSSGVLGPGAVGRRSARTHIHHVDRQDASGLACYWGQETEKLGNLETSEEAIVGRFFKEWLRRGLTVKVGRDMIDLFFADPELYGSANRWKRFVSNAETIRQCVVNRYDYDPEVGDLDSKLPDDDAHRWLEELGASA